MEKYRLPPRVMLAIEEACNDEVTVADILSRSQMATVVAARRRVCVRLRNWGYSFPQIGRWLDRHHTAVLSMVRQVQPSDPWMPEAYDPEKGDESGIWAI